MLRKTGSIDQTLDKTATLFNLLYGVLPMSIYIYNVQATRGCPESAD